MVFFFLICCCQEKKCDTRLSNAWRNGFLSHYKSTVFSDESREYFSFMVYKFLQVLRNPQSSPNLFLFRFTFSYSLNAQSTAEKFNNRASDRTTQWGPWVPLISFDIWKFFCELYRKRQISTSMPHSLTERSSSSKEFINTFHFKAPCVEFSNFWLKLRF